MRKLAEGTNRTEYPEALVVEYVQTRNPKLRDKIVALYSEMVHRIARKFSGIEAQEDLVQVGFIGLLNALSLYEPDKGVRFSTYATHLVAGAMKHYLRDRSKMIREPAWLQEIRHRVNKTAARLQQEMSRDPTPEEISQSLDVPLETVREVLSTNDLFRVTSLSGSPSSEQEETDDLELAGECRELLNFEDRLLLERAISELRGLERQVLLLFHVESMNQTEIATQLGISCNYVSHILRQSLTKLRATLANEERLAKALLRQADQLPADVIDDTTEVYSEHFLVARLDEECTRAASEGSNVGYITVRFDGLNTLRKFYGADALTHFLKDAAKFIRSSVRRLDTVGRIGETGFGIVLPGLEQTVHIVSQRLKSRLQKWQTNVLRVGAGITIHFGESCFPKDGRTAKQLIAAAKLIPFDSLTSEAA